MFGIGELARKTDCPVETIRYYEKLGLIPQPPRTQGNHRLYNQQHEQRLRFIKKTRGLGFGLENTKTLLMLSKSNHLNCSETLALVQSQLSDVDQKIAELQRMKASLTTMAARCQSCCPGAKAPDCTIVEDLNQVTAL